MLSESETDCKRANGSDNDHGSHERPPPRDGRRQNPCYPTACSRYFDFLGGGCWSPSRPPRSLRSYRSRRSIVISVATAIAIASGLARASVAAFVRPAGLAGASVVARGRTLLVSSPAFLEGRNGAVPHVVCVELAEGRTHCGALLTGLRMGEKDAFRQGVGSRARQLAA
eukprot:scaffold1315_cov23-Cyclotella_meneghiniana.AAC.6